MLLAATAVLVSFTAHAVVTISNSPTKNMVCAGGVCTPTHKDATLNVTDLQNLLATSSTQVTTGSGTLAAQTDDIVVAVALTWASTSVLTLDAYESVTINKSIAVTGVGGVTLTTDDGGTDGALSFGAKGNIGFANLTSSLTINGSAYTLVGNIATLASDIAANPSGNYALAANYNAASDGTYTSSPIATTFDGNFEGLGNTISSFSLRDASHNANDGLLAHIGSSGVVSDLRLTKVRVVSSHLSNAGGLVAQNDGLTNNDSASGSVAGGYGYIGGLVGLNNGTIQNSHAASKVRDGGGLVGRNLGSISRSFATGAVTGIESGGLVTTNSGGLIDSSFATGAATNVEDGGSAAGLVANDVQGGAISNCYATGKVSGTYYAAVGGLVGYVGDSVSDGTVSNSYSTGEVSGSGAEIGALVGGDKVAGDITDSYWDTTTSGITNLSDGAGNRSNDPGITGLTTSQLQSGLPTGFDPSVWGQNPSINGGLPYLLVNPPP